MNRKIFLIGAIAASGLHAFAQDSDQVLRESYVSSAKNMACRGIVEGVVKDFEGRPEKAKRCLVMSAEGHLDFQWVVWVTDVGGVRVAGSFSPSENRWHVILGKSKQGESIIKSVIDSVDKIIAEKPEEGSSDDIRKSGIKISIRSFNGDKADFIPLWDMKDSQENPQWLEAKKLAEKLMEGSD
ncbi:hypothetical protein [Haloferula sp. BvORR071]|uniref:hypothetical protein n=1 Tax=Haloferula sp. BvORR071 TaxID=1396141 RepID=UPI00055134C0|nr:hypothetical protein [Haloferula sp. BvORR071]